MKITPRDRLLLALVPAVLVAGIHVYWLSPRLQRGLSEQQDRLAALAKPGGGDIAGLLRGVGELEEKHGEALAHRTLVTQRIAAAKGEFEGLEAQRAAVRRQTEASTASVEPPADALRKVGRVFERHGLTPRSTTTEPADRAMLPLLAAMSGRAQSGEPPPVRRIEVDGDCKTLLAALRELVQTVPAVIPLSLDLERDPTDEGRTRRMTLWLWF